ncbi:unannotated protein [freshwater metagenome]|uniref:Unannotated protein n=1 Tax=freshwater metagenome TaxID=449393 RepID=A0A6J7IZ37_9ZZZZ
MPALNPLQQRQQHPHTHVIHQPRRQLMAIRRHLNLRTFVHHLPHRSDRSVVSREFGPADVQGLHDPGLDLLTARAQSGSLAPQLIARVANLGDEKLEQLDRHLKSVTKRRLGQQLLEPTLDRTRPRLGQRVPLRLLLRAYRRQEIVVITEEPSAPVLRRHAPRVHALPGHRHPLLSPRRQSLRLSDRINKGISHLIRWVPLIKTRRLAKRLPRQRHLLVNQIHIRLRLRRILHHIIRPQQRLRDVTPHHRRHVLPETVRPQIHPTHPQRRERHGLGGIARVPQPGAVVDLGREARLEEHVRESEGDEVLLDSVVDHKRRERLANSAVDILLRAQADVGIARPHEEVALAAEPSIRPLCEALPSVEDVAGITQALRPHPG